VVECTVHWSVNCERRVQERVPNNFHAIKCNRCQSPSRYKGMNRDFCRAQTAASDFCLQPKAKLLGGAGAGPLLRVPMRGGDGVPWPAAGAENFGFFSAILYLFSWEFAIRRIAAMLSRLATACRR